MSQADAIIKNFANAMVFRSLEPPSANGKVFGFALGAVVSATQADDINEALGSTQNIGAVPAADIVLVGQGPLGLALEIGLLPSVDINSFKFTRRAANLRWTFTEVLLRKNIPFDASIRVGFGKNEFSYQQVTSGVTNQIGFDSKATRLELAMSRKFLVFEPYFGVGLLRTSSTLAGTASAPLYNFTSSTSHNVSKSSLLLNLGTEIRLAILTLTAEADWAFGEATAAVKLGLKF